ncbi:hypothetical protein N656DRAFT_706663 [Canariomyces notabilis]|uniref:Uncharacterized protein n=1 Tax=Canariomyces notabilis TaxID=2074819 RepID=A0AAN6TGU9_9PEZI|nr:hypothetical protein N656DRAFT_706663 [Canariomyces arenarius]
MTAGSDFRIMLPDMGLSHLNPAPGPETDSLGSQPRLFRKHKVLPHPPRDVPQRSSLWDYGLGSDALLPRSGDSSLYLLQKRQARRGPEPPPTPPAHSRGSSSSNAVNPLTRRSVSGPSRSTANTLSRGHITPPDQQTPPTPNLTPERNPPGVATRQTQTRPPISDRIPSKNTNDSGTGSFITARENASSSDDEGSSTLRPILPSTKTSQSTVRQLSKESKGRSGPVGLGLGLESNTPEDFTPRTTGEFQTFDGEWIGGDAGPSEVEVEWDDNLGRNVTVKKRRPTASREVGNREVIGNSTPTQTNASKALRSVSLQESPVVYSSRRVVSERLPNQITASYSDTSSSIEYKRSSIMSTKSTASTVVEAVLMETAPQRRKTLRHIRKQSALRDSGSEISPPSSAPTSVSAPVDDVRRQAPAASRLSDTTRQSYASTATCNSISSRKARREVWKNGGIPVVVVPDRRSSIKGNSKEPSLRSTSSRRSQRSQSLGSAPISPTSKSKDGVPRFERPDRRSRALSESDGTRAGDERTIDFPPAIPARSSSLSAPTSRIVSRTGSLTAESLRAHNAFQAQQAHQALQKASRELEDLYGRNQSSANDEKSRHPERRDHQPPSLLVNAESERQPAVLVHHAPEAYYTPPEAQPDRSSRGHGGFDSYEANSYGLGADGCEDTSFGKSLSVQNTPFSVASVETNGTSHAEVSEAMAVNIYPHQSKSIVLVDSSTKPSESSFSGQSKPPEADITTLKVTVANGDIPVTPPQQFSLDDVDSPLRNPRAPPAPPQPPAINFIPATPSGLTPTVEKEKQLGNYYEITAEKPRRSLSLLRRTLTRRLTSEYGPSPSRPAGLLTRTFSLSRNVRKRPDDRLDGDAHRRPRLQRRASADDSPMDESRLHPFWRPAYIEDESSEDDEDWIGEPPDDRTYKYPPIDNRPALPRRSLSARIKRTFAILPVRNDLDGDYYPAIERDETDRRTIRRTPSGNLRVMRFRRSMESLTRIRAEDDRPFSGPDHGQQSGNVNENRNGRYTRLWRSLSVKARPRLHSHSPAESGSPGFLPALGQKMNLTRRLSERRREKRTQELRGMISAPREVRDGVGDVIRPGTYREPNARQYQQV